jgi:hypothetical protein
MVAHHTTNSVRYERKPAGIGATLDYLDTLRKLSPLIGCQLGDEGDNALNAIGRRRHVDSMRRPRRDVDLSSGRSSCRSGEAVPAAEAHRCAPEGALLSLGGSTRAREGSAPSTRGQHCFDLEAPLA